MRPSYEEFADLSDALRRAAQLRAKTVLVDVEPLVAFWDSGQEALDVGIAAVVGTVAAIPGLLAVCFTTNSARRPSALPQRQDLRVLYLASARKPFRTAPYRELPRPGVMIGDQLATDGILARRLGYSFLRCSPPLEGTPSGPRLMERCGRLARPLVFARGRAGAVVCRCRRLSPGAAAFTPLGGSAGSWGSRTVDITGLAGGRP